MSFDLASTNFIHTQNVRVWSGKFCIHCGYLMTGYHGISLKLNQHSLINNPAIGRSHPISQHQRYQILCTGTEIFFQYFVWTYDGSLRTSSAPVETDAFSLEAIQSVHLFSNF